MQMIDIYKFCKKKFLLLKIVLMGWVLEYKGVHVENFGICGVFSYPTKQITTGEVE